MGLRDGPFEASDDSSVKERKKQAELVERLEKLKDEHAITTEEMSQLNKDIERENLADNQNNIGV